MNLLELMLKEEVKWPISAEFAAQDGDELVVWFYRKRPIIGSGMIWNFNPDEHGLANRPKAGLPLAADDRKERVITREEYQAAGGVIANDGLEPFVSLEDAQECKAECSITPSKYTK